MQIAEKRALLRTVYGLIGVFDRTIGRQQTKQVHVDVVDELKDDVECAQEVADFALSLQLDAQQNRIVAKSDDEHVADLLQKLDQNSVLGHLDFDFDIGQRKIAKILVNRRQAIIRVGQFGHVLRHCFVKRV